MEELEVSCLSLSPEAIPVTIFQVNNHILTKHHLLDRDGKDVRAVADDLVGLHATSNVTPYLSLFNRIEKFSANHLSRELYEKKGLVRVRAMRGTFFLFTQRLLPTVAKATQFSQERINRGLAKAGISPREFQTLSESILDNLSGGAKTLPEIKQDLFLEHSRSRDWKRGRRITRPRDLGATLHLLLLQRKVQSQTEPLDWRSIDWDGYGSRIFAQIRKVVYSLAPGECRRGNQSSRS